RAGCASAHRRPVARRARRRRPAPRPSRSRILPTAGRPHLSRPVLAGVSPDEQQGGTDDDTGNGPDVDTREETEMSTLFGIALALAPFAAIIGLLRLAGQVSRRRERSRERQVVLTDAIHRELGAAAAPDVRQRLGGEWLVTMRVPLDRPGTVAAL